MKRKEIHPRNASINEITTGMIITIVQQQRPPISRARDSERSSSRGWPLAVIRWPSTPFLTITPRSSSRGKEPSFGMYSYLCSQDGHLILIEPSMDWENGSVRRCSQNGHAGNSDIFLHRPISCYPNQNHSHPKPKMIEKMNTMIGRTKHRQNSTPQQLPQLLCWAGCVSVPHGASSS